LNHRAIHDDDLLEVLKCVSCSHGTGFVRLGTNGKDDQLA